MITKKITALACVFAFISASGCGTAIPDNRDIIDNYVDESSSLTSSVADDSKTEIKQTNIAVKKINYTKYDKTLQAENGVKSGNTKVATERKGYKGKGYITGFNGKDSRWSIGFSLNYSQFYNVSITAACNKPANCKLAINGEIIGDVSLSGGKAFETFSLNNIYIPKGEAVISLVTDGQAIDVDYVRVLAVKNTIVSTLSDKTSLANKNADANTKGLYKYIKYNYGKKVLLGQHDTIGTKLETDMIYEVTGKYPAIRFGDLMTFTEKENLAGEAEIQCAVDWNKTGGIVGYMWHWEDPMGSGEYYADKTDFDITKAVTKEKIATLSAEQIETLHKKKKISDECVAIIRDIDKISKQLKTLQDKGVAVLWRPIHEASNGYFWWGKDAASYKWLWNLLYERQTNYHKLNNLIWVWSAQNSEWYVGDDKCDILSADIYDKDNFSGQINTLLYLTKICSNKPIAISECGNFPDMTKVAEENALWSYIGQWGGNYLIDKKGELIEDYNTAAHLKEVYNNTLVITKDKLPHFSNTQTR